MSQRTQKAKAAPATTAPKGYALIEEAARASSDASQAVVEAQARLQDHYARMEDRRDTLSVLKESKGSWNAEDRERSKELTAEIKALNARSKPLRKDLADAKRWAGKALRDLERLVGDADARNPRAGRRRIHPVDERGDFEEAVQQAAAMLVHAKDSGARKPVELPGDMAPIDKPGLDALMREVDVGLIIVHRTDVNNVSHFDLFVEYRMTPNGKRHYRVILSQRGKTRSFRDLRRALDWGKVMGFRDVRMDIDYREYPEPKAADGAD